MSTRDRPAPGAAAYGAVAYAVLAYGAFLAVAAYAVGFLANRLVPVGIDGPTGGTTPAGDAGSPLFAVGVDLAVVVDLALIALFGVQHSVMARAWFKRRWTRLVPVHLERSSYVLVTSLVLLLLFVAWQPLPTTVWEVDAAAGRIALWSLYGAGWVLVVGSTFLIDHLDLFGLRQVHRHARGRSHREPGFATPLLHRLVRHPMMVGFLVAFWATPTMTVGHLLFAAGTSAYILLGVRLEERDLLAGCPQYAAYAARTPRFVPRLRPTMVRPGRAAGSRPEAPA